MILIDSSVWIDLFANQPTVQTIMLERLVQAEQVIASGDLIVAEVLQGARDDRHAEYLLQRLDRFCSIAIGGREVAMKSARNYRVLRSLGITVRKTIDTLIATRCIVDDIPLLYADRDFDPFVEYFGLRPALDPTGAS